MDLHPLKIDRGTATAARRTRRSQWPARAVFLLAIAALAWYFRVPIRRWADDWRLPRVRVVEAYAASALSRGAVSGTAANGYIVPRVRAALSADTPGRIVELNVQEGSVLRRGDVVARLYSDEYEAAVEIARSELAAAEAGASRAQAEVETARAMRELQRTRVLSAQARLAAAASDVAFASREKDRFEELSEAGFSSEQALDQATNALERATRVHESETAAADGARAEEQQAERALAASEAFAVEFAARVPVAQAQLEQASATLAKTYVRAPFDGVVVLKDAEVGEVVSPNALGGNSRGSVATMVDFSTLEAQVELAETSISGVKIGDGAAIFLDAFSDKRYAGRVDRIWPTANRQKATIEVRVVFLEPDELLKPEMGVRVVFSPPSDEPIEPMHEPGSITLPSSTLVREGDRVFVFVVERERAHARDVVIARENGERTTISSGIEAGAKVIVEPPSDLADGDGVRIQE